MKEQRFKFMDAEGKTIGYGRLIQENEYTTLFQYSGDEIKWRDEICNMYSYNFSLGIQVGDEWLYEGDKFIITNPNGTLWKGILQCQNGMYSVYENENQCCDLETFTWASKNGWTIERVKEE